MDRRSLAVLAAAFFGLGALVVFTGRSPEGPAAELTLAAASGGAAQRWDACPAPKCLTVYVAPWCGVCRASTALINAVVDFLDGRGVPARVVVGQGRAAEVEAYAREFGPKTLLDPDGRVPLAGGVPQFIVTAGDGRVLRRQPGVPRIIRPPVPASEVRDLAAFLGLI